MLLWTAACCLCCRPPMCVHAIAPCSTDCSPACARLRRFALHALALGSPLAVADLWSRFVGTLRLAYWDTLQPLPRMQLGSSQLQAQPDAETAAQAGGSSGPEPPNLELSLLHQKLQLLNVCIHLQQGRQQQGQRQPRQQPQQPQADSASQGSAAALQWESSWDEGEGEGAEPAPASPTSSASSYVSASAGSDASSSPAKDRTQPAGSLRAPAGSEGGEDARPQGAVGVLTGAALHLHPDRPLRIPAVQEPPQLTEDLLAESQAALQARAGPAAGPGCHAAAPAVVRTAAHRSCQPASNTARGFSPPPLCRCPCRSSHGPTRTAQRCRRSCRAACCPQTCRHSRLQIPAPACWVRARGARRLPGALAGGD